MGSGRCIRAGREEEEAGDGVACWRTQLPSDTEKGASPVRRSSSLPSSSRSSSSCSGDLPVRVRLESQIGPHECRPRGCAPRGRDRANTRQRDRRGVLTMGAGSSAATRPHRATAACSSRTSRASTATRLWTDPTRRSPSAPTRSASGHADDPATGSRSPSSTGIPLFFGPMAFATDLVDGIARTARGTSRASAEMRLENIDVNRIRPSRRPTACPP